MKAFLLISLFVISGCFPRPKPVAVAPKPKVIEPPILALFSDTRRYKVGDLINVQVIESASGSKKSSSKIEKETDILADMSANSVVNEKDESLTAKFGLKSRNNLDGENEYEKTGRLVATVASTVIDVLPGGNLVIEGSREITIDKGVQTLHLTGIVDPKDIGLGNTVVSSRLANAKISYNSKREPRVHKQGIIGWLLNWVF